MKNIFFLLTIAVIFVLPVTILFLYAVSGIWSFPALIPESFSLRSLKYIISQSDSVFTALINSTIISISTVLLSFFLTVLPASIFSRFEFKCRKFLEMILLLPVLIPSITFSMGIHFLFLKTGLSDNMPGVILVLTAFSYPYMLRSLSAGFSTYSPDFEKCAENLGASLLRRIIQIHIPMLLPSIIAGGSIVFLVAFSEYFLVFLIGGGVVNSYTGFLFPFLNSSDRSIGAALTLLFMVIPLLMFFVADILAARLYRKRGMDF